MTVELTTTLKKLTKGTGFGAQGRQDRITKYRGAILANEVDGQAIPLLAVGDVVADYREAVTDARELSRKPRTMGEHAVLCGFKGPMMSKMTPVHDILSFGSGASRDGGWGDVTVFSGKDKVAVDVAWQRLVDYRQGHRSSSEAVMPLAEAAGSILNGEEDRTESFSELSGSFPGGITGIYNIARGVDPSGKRNDDDDQDDGQDDDGQDDGGSQSWQEMVAQAARRASEAGASISDVVALVNEVYAS